MSFYKRKKALDLKAASYFTLEIVENRR